MSLNKPPTWEEWQYSRRKNYQKVPLSEGEKEGLTHVKHKYDPYSLRRKGLFWREQYLHFAKWLARHGYLNEGEKK